MKLRSFFNCGFGALGVLALVAVLGAVGLTTVVAGQQTGFFNEASAPQGIFLGVVKRVDPCVSGNLCFELVQTNDGKNRYLLVRRGIFSATGIDLKKFVDKRVAVTGVEINKTGGKSFVAVKAVDMRKGNIGGQGDGKKKPALQMVTEIGTIFVYPAPVPSGFNEDSCVPRPECLDDPVHPCTIGMPPNGWCSQNPAGSPLPMFGLRAADGREYQLINSTGGTHCPPGGVCITLYRDPEDFGSLVGKKVIAGGSLKFPGNGQITYPWPANLKFDVTNIFEVEEVDPNFSIVGEVRRAKGAFALNRVFKIGSEDGQNVFVRSSHVNLEDFAGKNYAVTAVGTLFKFGVMEENILDAKEVSPMTL